MKNTGSSTVSNFFGGFLRGAGTGALMMGIFYTGMLLAGYPFALAPFLIGITSTGIFSGIMAAGRGTPVTHSPAATHNAASRTAPRAPEAVIAPVIAADRAETPSTNWAQKMERPGNSRISDILANGALSDKNRAAAILSAREAADKQPGTTR